jgi:hypothetical protein
MYKMLICLIRQKKVNRLVDGLYLPILTKPRAERHQLDLESRNPRALSRSGRVEPVVQDNGRAGPGSGTCVFKITKGKKNIRKLQSTY